MSISEDEDLPQLSSETFAGLQEFYKEQEDREKRLELLASETINGDVTIHENWQLSQFWYDDRTIEALVDVAIKAAGSNGNIALVSCPSLYRKLKEKADPNCDITLFEYDKRFAMYGKDFIMYDYKFPLAIPRDKSSYYDIVLADPPFLSEECLTKTAVTIKFLTKRKILLCTGAIMADLVRRLLDLKKSSFEPKHANNLANEFWCYTNFNIDDVL
ncbi:EEF1A lysine methyltransferase 1 [Anoplophora glabripennis]|uniref:EEF1A lysine methyltransferase 1 n=1 Tax=Anoplophora glabripennis TaxID=217634 RepID=UPI000874F02C|nr:EEF1A lysine methyltransferase 1 [Anoplophora glabripennis]